MAMENGREVPLSTKEKMKTVRNVLFKAPLVFLGSTIFLVGSWSVSGGIKNYMDSKVPKIEDRNSAIYNKISEDKKDFVRNKSEAVKALINYRMDGNQAQKKAVYEKLLTEASKRLEHAGNEYEFYYYVAEGFMQQESKYGTISYPAKDYFLNFLGDLFFANYAKKTKELNKSIEESIGEKRETLTEGAEIIKGFSENRFYGVQITAGRETMLEFYYRIVDKGANKTEAIAALLSLYNKFADNKAMYGNEWGLSDEDLDSYMNKVEKEMLSFRGKLVANSR